MIAPAFPARSRPLDDALVAVVGQDAEPADADDFLDALDRIVQRRLSQRATTGGQHQQKGARNG